MQQAQHKLNWRQWDVERALKAARKQGMTNPAFTIGVDGSITVFEHKAGCQMSQEDEYTDELELRIERMAQGAQ